MDLIIKNGTIVSPTATFKADVCVDNGKIVAITADAGTDADKVVDASGKMVLPGAIDAHTHLAMPKSFYEPHKKHIEFMVEAFMNTVNSDVAKYVTAIPHPFMAVACPYDNRTLLNEITDDDFKRCFDAAAQKGIALELNPNFLKSKSLKEAYNDPIFRMYRIGKECGCKFTVGTDAHSEKGYDNFEKIYIMTSLLELTTEDFHPSTR